MRGSDRGRRQINAEVVEVSELRDLIVPYRCHNLIECDRIITLACGIDRSLQYKTSKQTDQDIWRGWIDAIINEAKKPLNQYEQDFVTSVSDQLTMKGTLSEKQVKLLERIYTEKS